MSIKCAEQNLSEVLENFNGQRGNFPITYLGLPLTPGRIKRIHLQPVMDKLQSRLAGWKGKLIQQSGRKTLVTSVLSSIPTYFLTALKPPKQFLTDMDKIRKKFLLAGDQEISGGKCKVNWKKVCSPIKMGGLGVLDLDKFARALRLRWLWFEWECPDKPWVGTTPPCDELDEQIFAAATKVTIGNGRKAKFWTSNWIGHQPLKYLAPALFNHSKGKQRLVQDALTNDKWIEDIRHELSMPLIREFFAVFRLIWDNETNLEEGVEDTIIWRWTNTGKYTAKSAYLAQFTGREDSRAATLIWKTWAPSKCKNFAWLVLQNRIWTSDRLQLRQWPNNYFCQLCYRNLETAQHLFKDCPFTREIWDKIMARMNHNQPFPVHNPDESLVDWWESRTKQQSKCQSKGMQSLHMLLSWEIWCERNRRVFKDKELQIPQLTARIMDEIHTWSACGAKNLARIAP